MFHAIYRLEHRSRRFYLRIVYYLFSVCLSNAWILQKENLKTYQLATSSNKTNPHQSRLDGNSFLEFILSVSNSLILAGKSSRPVNPVGRPKNAPQLIPVVDS